METNFLLYLPIAISLLAMASFFERRRVLWKSRNSIGETVPLARFAERLFEKEFRGAGARERVLDALQLVLNKFKAGLVVVRIQAENTETPTIFSKSNANTEIDNDSLLYCRSLTRSRTELNLDFAGSGPWKDHPARTSLGWESYYGARLNGTGGEFISIGIYHSSPRLQQISNADKIFLQNLLAWIETTLCRAETENITNSSSDKIASSAAVRKEIPLEQ